MLGVYYTHINSIEYYTQEYNKRRVVGLYKYIEATKLPIRNNTLDLWYISHNNDTQSVRINNN